jgi:TolA-binding protein
MKENRSVSYLRFTLLKVQAALIFYALVYLTLPSLAYGDILSPFKVEDKKEEETLFVAQKAFEDGFYEVSLGLFERYLKDYPNSAKSAEVNLLIGECYFYQNRFLDALTKFEDTLKHPQANQIKDALLYWIAEVHFKGNVFGRAAEYYRMVITDYPKSAYAANAYYSLGWCLFQEAKFQEALKYFKIVEDNFHNDPQAQDATFKIIECLYNLKDYTALKNKLKSYFRAGPKDTARVAYLYFYLAEADYYLNNFTEAIDEYSKVIQGASDEKTKSLARLGTAWSYLKLKRYKEAENTLAELKRESLDKKSQDTLLLSKAILMSETNRFSEAKNIYDELLLSSEDTNIVIQAYLGKAEVLYNLANYSEAISVYQEALNRVSDTTAGEVVDKLHYGLAWAFLKEGEFKQAIDEFQKIVKSSEDKIVKIAALCQIGDTYQDSGDYNKAINTYSQILKEYPDSFYSDYVQYQLGLAMLKGYNYDGAILAFQSLKNNYPNSKLLDEATYSLGLTYFQREDYSSSSQVLTKFQKEFTDSNLKPQAMYLLATSLYNLGQFSEAIEVFKDIIKQYSQDTELIQKVEYEIADCYYQMGQEKEAMNRFKLLRSKYPDSNLTAEVMWWLGEYYYRHNDHVLARRYFSSLIQDFPKSNLVPSAYYALASTYENEGLYSEAIDNFRKVVDADKSDLAATAAVAIADIYARQNKFESAIRAYQDAGRKYANLVHLINPKIADIYYKNSDYEKALIFYRQSLNEVPAREMANVQFRIAETLQAQGKIPQAIEEYLKVTYLYSDDNDLAVKSLLRVAAIYEGQEDFQEAVNIYSRIAAMEVEESKYARECISNIESKYKVRRPR